MGIQSLVSVNSSWPSLPPLTASKLYFLLERVSILLAIAVFALSWIIVGILFGIQKDDTPNEDKITRTNEAQNKSKERRMVNSSCSLVLRQWKAGIPGISFGRGRFFLDRLGNQSFATTDVSEHGK